MLDALASSGSPWLARSTTIKLPLSVVASTRQKQLQRTRWIIYQPSSHALKFWGRTPDVQSKAWDLAVAYRQFPFCDEAFHLDARLLPPNEGARSVSTECAPLRFHGINHSVSNKLRKPKRLKKSQGERFRGRLQFAHGQLCGRPARNDIRVLSLHTESNRRVAMHPGLGLLKHTQTHRRMINRSCPHLRGCLLRRG